MTLHWSILASMNWKYNPFLYSHFSVWTLNIQMQVSNRLDSQSVRYTYQDSWCKYELLFLKRVSLLRMNEFCSEIRFRRILLIFSLLFKSQMFIFNKIQSQMLSNLNCKVHCYSASLLLWLQKIKYAKKGVVHIFNQR